MIASPPSWPRRLLRAGGDFIDLQWTLVVRALKRNAPQAKGRLLDVGCGDKPYLDLFLPYVTEYIGVEHDSTFLLTAASKNERKPDFLYDGKTLPFASQSFDTVLSIQVLEHTPDPAGLIAEMARVMKDDGLLILSAPFSFRLHEQPHDYFRYSPHGLRHLCALAGLRVDHIEAQGGLWSLLGHKLNSYLGLRVARLGALGAAVGKQGQEAVERPAVRWWTLPLVAPLLFLISAAARVLDRLLPEPDESLNFLIIARRA